MGYRVVSWISFAFIGWLIAIAVTSAACEHKPWDHRPVPGHRAEQAYGR